MAGDRKYTEWLTRKPLLKLKYLDGKGMQKSPVISEDSHLFAHNVNLSRTQV